MADRDDDRFRPKVGPPKARGHAPQSKFISRVLKQASKAGRTIGNARPALRPRKRGQFGRGQVAARLAGRCLGARSRRVMVKIRPVNLKKASKRSTEQHLRYIERDGVTRDGGRGQLFGADIEKCDRHEFEQRGSGDRHQFRIIVSPEDGHDLGDLKAFTRDLMAQVERDLGTKLQWVGVDHWDTDQPHMHVTLRGKDETGRDLVIAPEYISYGMRARASELATLWLGPRTELEIRQSLTKEVTDERWTSLDRTIQERARDGKIVVRDASSGADERFRTGLIIGRLDHLAAMGLARKDAALTYTLGPNLESTLRALSERGDIIRTMQRAMGRAHREHSIFDHTDPRARVVGRVTAKGLADELSDAGYLVIDGVDGRAHYVRLPERVDFTEFPRGSIVECQGGAEARRSDRNIDELAQDGIYRVDRHLGAAQEQYREGLDPQAFVQAHVRRLEALRRAGIAQRIEEGVWRVPPDLLERARAYDAERLGGARVDLRSPLPIAEQTRAIGATWLDQQLLRPELFVPHGFGTEVRAALDKRTDFLIEQGLAERRAGRVILAQNLLAVLRAREIETVARNIESQTGLVHRPVVDGQSVTGTYRRSVMLTSGRFAMLDDATGFSLVPWRPVIEPRLGKPIGAVVRGNFVSWELGRSRGVSR